MCVICIVCLKQKIKHVSCPDRLTPAKERIFENHLKMIEVAFNMFKTSKYPIKMLTIFDEYPQNTYFE